MNNPFIPVEQAASSVDLDPVALIGLGQRGCEAICGIRQTLDFESFTFLLDNGVQETWSIGAKADGNGLPERMPNLSACGLMGVVIVGADYYNPEVVQALQNELLRERPALVLGIVLPPCPEEPIRLDPNLQATWDCVINWPNDPRTPVDRLRLAMAVSDWLSPVVIGGLICIDIADILTMISCGQPPQELQIDSSATMPLEQSQTAAQMALADLYRQGFVLEECRGMLVVIRVGLAFTISLFEAVGDVFMALPSPEPFRLALTSPFDAACIENNLSRVTIFAVCPS